MEVRNVVKELDSYVPGRSQEEIAKEFNVNIEDIIKLGSNENPWGPSPKIFDVLNKELKNINRYPETDIHLLKEELAKYTNLNTNQIIVAGDGADEIIDVLAKTFINPGDEFITPLPTYTYYEFLFKPYGAIPVYGRWDLETNTLDLDSILDNITDKTKMIFLCSPNNPTGAIISKDDIRTIAKATDALIIVDEAYFEYAEINNVDLLDEFSNIFIIRTMSKVMGLAGMRIGYGLSNSEIIEYMHRIKPVFSLTRLSYLAALVTLRDKDFIVESTRKGIESREYLFEELSKFKSLNVFKSKSNYIFLNVKETGMNASEFTKELMKKGVIIRDCTSFKGIDEYWVRLSIGTLEEDEEFIKRLHTLIE